MKAKQLLMTGPNVQRIQRGVKTQTRRVAKLTAAGHVKEPGGNRRWHPGDLAAAAACPYGPPGRRLWVRETWQPAVDRGGWPCIVYRADSSWWAPPGRNAAEIKRAFPVIPEYELSVYEILSHGRGRWRPSIFMPRWACRMVLEVLDVRVERLQDITGADARAEGIGPKYGKPPVADSLLDLESVAKFSVLWDEINSKRGYGWDANPWVWVVQFRHLEGMRGYEADTADDS